jgi:opacity protein-like surface antigen
MKKITSSAILALVLTTAFTEAGSLYIGLEQSLMNNIDNTTEIGNYSYSNDESSNITSIKIGKTSDNSDKGNHYEFVYNMGEKSANPTGGLKGSSLTSLSFNWNITTPTLTQIDEILPYFRLGINYSISDDKYYVRGTKDKENYSAFGFILGIGSYYYLNDNVNLFAGFDYGYRKWNKLSNSWYEIESTDKIKKLYIGAEYLF